MKNLEIYMVGERAIDNEVFALYQQLRNDGLAGFELIIDPDEENCYRRFAQFFNYRS